ncbi:ATP-dependent RNA helicase DDX5/DBP2 [Angomonas deanei]|uniref:Probable eukaryotic initiation factor 4A n=1 Tax=Angomonas deanei TaxID=59799 RepID=A0A7G2CT73_9TRYP|nr:ATP-dependent RNA helicase DDX5/DBP2 [Angomonas deanei]CAD2222134.1 DEAD/DEAH box helicase/Helicase conserved C-terminal domain containing protein, putative [Angomonas deanei]|eukprot:EPY40438.1 ATP-dependent RNA helicase DDX5/DBP2 [Angomonas deanei]
MSYNNNGGYGGGYQGGYRGGSGGGYGGGYHNSYGGGGGGYRGGMSNIGANLRSINWNEVNKVAAEWNFYKPQKERSEEEIRRWMDENAMTIYGERVPQPMLEFSDLVAPDAIHQGFADAGYKAPTAIQAMAWPILLNGRDIVGIARTGSGKTMGFMIPAALHIMAQPPLQPGDGPIALVMAPTRELAVQIETETQKALRRIPNVITTCVYGGTPKGPQVQALRAGVHVCIATPGRLLDLLEMGATNLLRITYLVLDEADRMLDMGFEDQIRKVCSQIRSDRQTLMFSATWPKEIRNLAASFQRDFIRVHVGSEDLTANKDVAQHVMVLQPFEKNNKLEEVLRQVGPRRVLIFTKTKKTADYIHEKLRRDLRQTVLVIHGDKMQSTRDYVIERFRKEENVVLVATDVAARGLDIKNLDVVINYDMPLNIEDYVHRIGRTGRAGKSGDAFTFVCSEDPSKTIRDLIDVLTRSNQAVPNELYGLSAQGGGGRGGRGGRGRGRGGYSHSYNHHQGGYQGGQGGYQGGQGYNNYGGNPNPGGYSGGYRGRGGSSAVPSGPSFSPY